MSFFSAQPYMISKIKLLLYSRDERFYSYYIETSIDNDIFEMAVDLSDTLTQSWQEVTFPRRIAVFVKITGTFCSAGEVSYYFGYKLIINNY